MASRVEIQEWTVADLPESLSDQDFSFLMKLADQGKTRMLPGEKRGSFRIQGQSWVGTIRLNQIELSIRPKFPIENVYGMMAFISENEFGNSNGLDGLLGSFGKSETLPELIAKVFVNQFLRLIRSEVNQGYIKTRKNSSVMRGKFLVQADLRENWPVRTGLFCEYQDRSLDTPAHRIFALTLENLRQSELIKNKETREKIRESISLFSGGFLSGFNFQMNWRHDLKLVQSQRLSKSYQEVLSLAELILRNFTLDLGKEYGAQVFLINMNQLFEDYIRKNLACFVSENCLDSEFEVSQRGQVRAYLCQDQHGKGVYEELPDIGIFRNGKLVYLLDAKYKNYDVIQPDKEDIRQLALYLFSFETYGVNRVDLVYPGVVQRPSLFISKEKEIGFLPLNLEGNWNQLNSQSHEWSKKIFDRLKNL